jgi:parvulin-like peptidyl-prolyl isomerase
VCVASSQQKKKKKEEGMNYADFDPYVIRERNQQVHREVQSLRLEERLREERGSSGSRFVALARRAVRPLLRGAVTNTAIE